MQDQLKQLVERINQAQNILVTVGKNPSVDQLAACIGLTLVLNHLGKHGTAVFSGTVPSTLEFLKPEETLEKNTDSLRDFIIALDKSKADKLRYKVEDQVVRIFITPYKTSITDKDLDFSQGDFNVDVVVALGVREQQDLDEAITAHGRILHDATVATINTEPNGNLGTMNVLDTEASSLCELVVDLAHGLDKKVIDSQIATALLTGVVSATERFRNDRTTPKTMSVSATLMSAGANQQLIATQLEVPEEEPEEQGADMQGGFEGDAALPPEEEHKAEPGTLEINHADEPQEPAEEHFAPPYEEPAPESDQPQIHVNEEGQLINLGEKEPTPEISGVHGVSSEEVPNIFKEPQKLHENRPAETEPTHTEKELLPGVMDDEEDPTTADSTQPAFDMPVLSHDAPKIGEPEEKKFTPPPVPEVVLPELPGQSVSPQPAPFTPPQFNLPTPPVPEPQAEPEVETKPEPEVPIITPDETLAEIEKSVESPHAQDDGALSADEARRNVEAALRGVDTSVPAAFNALPLGNDLHDTAAPEPSTPTLPEPSNPGFHETMSNASPADQSLDMPLPQNAFPSFQPPTPSQPVAPPSAFPGAPTQGSGQNPNPNAPPPVPPPMLPPMQ